MNLHSHLRARADAGKPIRVALIGAGKFGTMFLSQARVTPGLHVLGIADLSVARARQALEKTGWSQEQTSARSAAKALAQGTTYVTDDAIALIEAGVVDVVVEATGVPEAGVTHALAAIERNRHVVMVNVEADVLCGPLLARKARANDVVYSLAYGDQPALICEQVDWARAAGFEVVAAGKGTLYMPEFHASTPDTIWDHYGLNADQAEQAGMNGKMFNSFLDGTKSGIEMAAVSNATGLTPPPGGLDFPPCGTGALAATLIPEADGGVLHHKGQVEVISSRDRDGTDLEDDLRWGVYLTFEAPGDYARDCFAEYGLVTDNSGRYTALWRPYHMIGLELGISVAYSELLGQATGAPDGFRADVAAVAKSDLKAGTELDGEGGYTVWGRLMVAGDSMSLGALPIGLAQGVKLTAPVKAGQVVTWNDVEVGETLEASVAFKARREMELAFSR